MIIDLSIYPCKVIVCFGDKQAVKILEGVADKKELEMFLTDENVGLTFMFSCGDLAIYLKEKPRTAYGFSKLAHEIYHCATYVLNYVGVKHSKKSDEAFAYLVGFLTEKIFEPLVDGDEWHTTEELYQHRYRLFLAFLNGRNDGWKSKTNADGSKWDGYFVCGCGEPEKTQVTYHLPVLLWDACLVPEIEKGFWDGHTSVNVLDRLLLF